MSPMYGQAGSQGSLGALACSGVIGRSISATGWNGGAYISDTLGGVYSSQQSTETVWEENARLKRENEALKAENDSLRRIMED